MFDNKKYQHEWRLRRIASGCCYTCSHRPAIPGKRQCSECTDKRRARERKRYEGGLCGCGKPRGTKAKCEDCYARHARWIAKPANRKRWNTQTNARNAAIRLEVIAHYGGKCVCCGESGSPFLTMDHKKNGKEDRAKYHSGEWWRVIRRLGYPDHLQILCWNCNMGKQHYGNGVRCPHTLTPA